MRQASFYSFATLMVCFFSGAAAQDLSVSGQVRGLWSEQTVNEISPATLSERLLSGLSPSLVPAANSMGVVETELHLSRKGITAIATAQGRLNETEQTRGTHATAWINELYGTVGDGAWQLSAGRKIVAWDVGYGFRPNDVVQQEKRRNLIGSTLIGRSVASVDYFDAKLAASLVWINPDNIFQKSETDKSLAEEQALAARIYYRAGGVDLHGFAKYGFQSGTSVGVALAWVATDALELHASARYLQRNTARQTAGNLPPSQKNSAWLAQTQTAIAQVLLGATWTTDEQHSFLLEAWWDGTALSAEKWRQWSQGNSFLIERALGRPNNQRQLGYQLALQSQALSSASNLQQQNVFARWSWQTSTWQPSVDILWTPQDGGRVVTAAIGWQGDRWHLDGGVRFFGGPNPAVLAQLPSRGAAYLSSTWSF